MKGFQKECDICTYRQTDLLTDKVIHGGAPLLIMDNVYEYGGGGVLSKSDGKHKI